MSSFTVYCPSAPDDLAFDPQEFSHSLHRCLQSLIPEVATLGMIVRCLIVRNLTIDVTSAPLVLHFAFTWVTRFEKSSCLCA